MIAHCRQKTVLLVVLLLTGCAQYQLVNAGDSVAMGDAFTMKPQRAWSRIDHGHIELWTVDGPLLEQVVVYKGLKDGQDLLIPNPLGEKAEDFPTFQKEMTALEVRDLLEATFSRAQEVDVQTFEMKPWKFADADGFRFEYTFTTKSGLRKRGFTVGAIHDERLFMIVFSAAEIYYFDKYADELEKLVSSVERRA
jgi:hypothetical protein